MERMAEVRVIKGTIGGKSFSGRHLGISTGGVVKIQIGGVSNPNGFAEDLEKENQGINANVTEKLNIVRVNISDPSLLKITSERTVKYPIAKMYDVNKHFARTGRHPRSV